MQRIREGWFSTRWKAVGKASTSSSSSSETLSSRRRIFSTCAENRIRAPVKKIYIYIYQRSIIFVKAASRLIMWLMSRRRRRTILLSKSLLIPNRTLQEQLQCTYSRPPSEKKKLRICCRKRWTGNEKQHVLSAIIILLLTSWLQETNQTFWTLLFSRRFRFKTVIFLLWPTSKWQSNHRNYLPSGFYCRIPIPAYYLRRP